MTIIFPWTKKGKLLSILKGVTREAEELALANYHINMAKKFIWLFSVGRYNLGNNSKITPARAMELRQKAIAGLKVWLPDQISFFKEIKQLMKYHKEQVESYRTKFYTNRVAHGMSEILLRTFSELTKACDLMIDCLERENEAILRNDLPVFIKKFNHERLIYKNMGRILHEMQHDHLALDLKHNQYQVETLMDVGPLMGAFFVLVGSIGIAIYSNSDTTQAIQTNAIEEAFSTTFPIFSITLLYSLIRAVKTTSERTHDELKKLVSLFSEKKLLAEMNPIYWAE